jgi:Uma2 family endonuclease
MIPVLDHPTLREQVLPLTVASYHLLSEAGLVDRKTELIRGFVLPKMSKSPRHSSLFLRLFRILSAHVPAGHSIRPEQPLTCHDSEPEPDIAIVKGGDEDYKLSHPTTALLVVEVSLSTEDRDIEKIGIYAEAGVCEYWLLRPDENCVDVFTNPEAGKYLNQRRLGLGDVIVSGLLPGVKVELGKLLA